jgi:radical SAM superfamily enzyme YgiQ (UPF0313 family)
MSSIDPATPLVCLIRPPGAETFRIGASALVPPLGLAYVAAAIEGAGHAVVVLDALTAGPTTHTKYFQGHLVGLRLEDIPSRIPDAAFAVGITCMFTHEWPMVVQLIGLIKQRRPDMPVVVGGEHVTAMPEFSLATSQADVLALGEGEETASELFQALRSRTSLADIDGIAFRLDGAIVVNRRRLRKAALGEIRRPAWHLIDLEAYHEHRFVGGVYSATLTVPMLATRGCPYQCTYCSSPNMWTTKWIPRDPSDVADEMQGYVEHYGAGNFPFYDLTAVIRKEWIVAFCREIINRGLLISWQMASGTRSEAIDAEVAELLRESGMVNMAYAPESGSDLTRRYIKKKVQREKIFASIEAAARSELSVAANIVIGFPHDGRQEMRETLGFVRDMARRGVNDLQTAYYMALPGTELFRTLYEQGKIVIDRAYFRHILNALSITPTASYSEKMGLAELFYWRLRFVAAFYLSRLRVLGIRETAASARQTVSARSHSSKLQTALRVSFRTGLATLRVALANSRWMPFRDEKTFFASWDGIYREITRQRRCNGVDQAPPIDPRDLHTRNFVAMLRSDHDIPRHLSLPAAATDPAVADRING